MRVVLIKNFQSRDELGQAGKTVSALKARGREIAVDGVVGRFVQVVGNIPHVARIPVAHARIFAGQFPQFGSQFAGFVADAFLRFARTRGARGFIIASLSFAVFSLSLFVVVTPAGLSRSLRAFPARPLSSDLAGSRPGFTVLARCYVFVV